MTKEDAKKYLSSVFPVLSDKMQEAIKVLEQEPRKMVGSWIKSRDSYGNNHFTCPFCEHDIATKADTLGDNYCSNCGAKLQESELQKSEG